MSWAKNKNNKAGLGQCIAEMVAAQIFNQQTEEDSFPIYGCVIKGKEWKFLQLEEQRYRIDLRDYFIVERPKILGILASPFSEPLLQYVLGIGLQIKSQ